MYSERERQTAAKREQRAEKKRSQPARSLPSRAAILARALKRFFQTTQYTVPEWCNKKLKIKIKIKVKMKIAISNSGWVNSAYQHETCSEREKSSRWPLKPNASYCCFYCYFYYHYFYFSIAYFLGSPSSKALYFFAFFTNSFLYSSGV